MLYVGVGQAEDVSEDRAVAKVVAQCKASIQDAAVQAGIIFASSEFDHRRISRAVNDAFPGIILAGGTTAGELSSSFGFSEDSVTLVVFASDTIKMAVGIGRNAGEDTVRAANDAFSMAENALGTRPALALVFPDGYTAHLNRITEVVAERYPHCPTLGAATGVPLETGDDRTPYEYYNDEVTQDAVVVFFFAGPIAATWKISHNRQPLGNTAKVTLVEGNVVKEIDDMRALDFFRYYLGEHTEPAAELPLAVYENEGKEFYIRAPLTYDTKSGSITFSGGIPEGATVQITEASRSTVIEDTERIAKDIAPMLTEHPPAVVFVFSCVIRKQILGTETAEEIAIIKKHLPEGTPVIGFYSFGEYAPITKEGKTYLHNATLSLLALHTTDGSEGERPAPLPLVTEEDEGDDALATLERENRFLKRKLLRATRARKRLETFKELNGKLLRAVNLEVLEAKKTIEELFREVEVEKEKSDHLLRNILPDDVADELKRTGKVKPASYESCSVLFTDVKGFTRISRDISARDLVGELDFYFSAFDRIVAQYELEKLKTIGDAYMCAGGLPVENTTHAVDIVFAALKMIDFMNDIGEEKRVKGEPPWEIRVGIHSGPLLAGVIGKKKFAYDIWGDTVNVASRLETYGEPGKVNISHATHELVKDVFECTYRGKLRVKNRGDIDMYFVEREKPL